MFIYNNPFISSSIPSFEEGGGTPVEETIYADHDDAYDYKMIDGVWYTQKKGGEEWSSLEDNEAATTKLNTAYPDAQIVENTTKVDNATDDTEIEKANKKVEEGTDSVFYNEEFRSPEEANLLSGIGDTGLFDLIKAIDTTAGSFKKENYYDSGTKADYSKFSHTNTTGQDMYVNFDALAKGKNTGNVLMDEGQKNEHYTQKYLDDRHKRNPDKYAKVKNFEQDLYDKTGSMNYRKGPFGMFKGEAKQGDMLENKYKDATHIGFETDKMGNYENAFDYLSSDPDDPTKFNAQDFDDGFAGAPWNPNDPNNYNYSEEYLNSSKHDPNIDWGRGVKGGAGSDNANINYNYDGTDRFSKRIPKPNDPNDFTNPQNVINANDKLREQEALRRQQEEQANFIEEQLRKSQGMKYGGDLPKAQTGLNEFCVNGAIVNSGGKFFAQCQNREFDSEHDFTLGMNMSMGKLDDEFTGSFKGTGGYTFNPSMGTGGLKTYIGGNYGGRATTDGGLESNDVNVNRSVNGVLALGYTGEVGGNSPEWRIPTQYELGAYADKDLIGNNGTTFGGYGRYGILNAKAGYNANTGSEFSFGLGLPLRQQGGDLPRAQKGLENTNRNSGYNPLTNQMDPLTFNTDFNVNPIDMNMFANMETPQEQTEPFFSSADNMYAMNQSVNRSMNSFDAFTADMNNRMENPSLQMNQIDTNPLNVPDFSNPDLDNQIQMNQDRMAFKTASEDGRVIGGNIIPTKRETRQNQKEFASQLKKTANDGPFGQGYQGTKKNLRRFDRSNELGFDGDLAAMDDYDNEENKQDFLRKENKKKLNRDNKDANPSFGDKLWNAKNRALDSKAGQTYSKIGAGAVRIAKPLNRMIEANAEREQKDTMMNNAYLSDNMWAANDADLTGGKGDYDVNSGIFRPDDKVTPGTTMTRYGGSFSNGGEMEIDMNTYKQLVSAGARIEIL